MLEDDILLSARHGEHFLRQEGVKGEERNEKWKSGRGLINPRVGKWKRKWKGGNRDSRKSRDLEDRSESEFARSVIALLYRHSSRILSNY